MAILMENTSNERSGQSELVSNPNKGPEGLPLTPKIKVFTPSTLRHEISGDNRVLIVYKSKVYNMTKYLKFHPGGDLALLYQNGKDSTDVIDAFHPFIDMNKKIAPFYVGEYLAVDDSDDEDSGFSSMTSVLKDSPAFNQRQLLAQPLASLGDGQVLSDSPIAQDYFELHKKLKQDGFYVPSYFFYIKRMIAFAAWISTAIYLALNYSDNTKVLALSAIMFGVFWHGLSFTVHDAGHHSVTCNKKFDDIFGCMLASFCGGLSVQWWKHNHNVHHIVTNEPEHDPDIQHLPFMAVTSALFDDLYSTFYRRVMKFDAFAKAAVSIQHILYYPLMCFGRFNLYAHSIQFLLNFKSKIGRQYRWLELCGMVFFWTWFGFGILGSIQGVGNKLMFLFLSHAATMILHVQITLSHFAMSTESEVTDELFVVKAARTTMNVDCPEWFDWFHGGLQFQIEHHMFPRIPRCHFRKLQPLVKEFCQKHNIFYQSQDFLQSNLILVKHLKGVAAEVFNYISPVPLESAKKCN